MESHFQYDEYNDSIKTNKKKGTSLLSNFNVSKWAFSLCLLLLSSAIVIGIIYINDVQSLIIKNKNYIAFYEKLNSYNFQYVFLSSNEFIRIVSSNIDKYQWFFKALSSGLAVTAFTWFIIYKDSNIPGVNPPSPFSPSKKKIADFEDPNVPLNYLIGVINGILIFIYMSL